MTLIDRLRGKHSGTWSRRKDRAARRRTMLVEGLEDRRLLTTLFTPQAPEQASDGGGTRLGDVPWGMPLYTIYWGSYWASAEGQTLQSQIQNSLNSMLYYSPYLDGLRQYGVPYHAGVPGSGTVEVNNYSDPSEGFSDDDLKGVINNAIDNQGLPDSDTFSNEGLYVVFTPPPIDFHRLDAASFHGVYTDYSFPFDFNTRHFAWIGDFGNLNSITEEVSHEVVEAMTNPDGDGIQVLPRDDQNWIEVADNEAEDYTAFINGYRVQSYWSQQDGAYAVYDGNSQVARVTNGELVINGDQLGTNLSDNITIDLNPGGGVMVTENGETFSFTSREIHSITVNPGGGSNTINVRRTSFSSPVTISGQSLDTVNIGFGGSVRDISGNVTIQYPPSLTYINVDDSADPTPQDARLTKFTPPGDSNWGQIYNLAPASITFKYADTK